LTPPAHAPDRPAAIAVLGAGMIGRQHIERVLAEDAAELMAIVDPAPSAKAMAKGAAWHPDLPG